VVEEDSAHVIEVTVQREQAPPRLVGPYLNLVIVSTRNEDGLRFMEIDASYWPIMFFKPVDKCAHAIIP
jgi:hypothetical protein